MKKYFFIVFAFFALTGCTEMTIDEFKSSTPRFVLENYFQGKTRAWGLFEDRFGKVRRQFVVDITGVWDGQTLVLDEDFLFDDGEKSFRQWRIKKLGDNQYEGRADDVVGKATGVSAGNALNWQYLLDLKLEGGSTLRVKFDDWMFLQSDGVLLNRAKMSKFGVELGHVIISFGKQPGISSIAPQSADDKIEVAAQ
jgi:hypothetical protein